MVNLFLHLDTRDSLNPNVPSKAVWNLNHIAKQVSSDVDIILQSVCIPNGVYPINANNNQFTFTDVGGTSTLTITPQHYTYSQFQTELQTVLNADATLSGTFTVTYDTQTRKYTISSTAAFTIDEGNGLAFLIGYTQNLPTSSATSHVAESLARLDGTGYVDIISPSVQHCYSANDVSRVMARIPLSHSFGTYASYSFGSQYPIRLSSSALSSLQIQIRDEFNRIWDLPKNCHVNLSFRLVSQSNASR